MAQWEVARILVVDDDPVSAAVAEAMLSADGYVNVVVATDGAQGRELVAEEDWDLVVLDLEMPGVSGFEILDVVGSRFGGDTHVPVLVLTGDETDDARQRALGLGATDFLVKPLRVDEARLRVRNMLRIRRLQVELQRANRDLTSFAYVAAHDLSQPLVALSSVLHVLKATVGGTERADSALATAESALNHMRELIDALLDYCRAGTDPRPADEEVSLDACAQLALSNLSVLIEGSGAVVRCGPLPAVQVPAVEVVRVLQNLVGNAIAHSHPEGVPEVDVSASPRGGRWTVRVDDNGPGIPAGDEHSVFAPLVRLRRPRREAGGVGMGLAICEQLVALWGGEIWVEQRPGGGSSFAFTIPAPGSASGEDPRTGRDGDRLES